MQAVIEVPSMNATWLHFNPRCDTGRLSIRSSNRDCRAFFWNMGTETYALIAIAIKQLLRVAVYPIWIISNVLLQMESSTVD